MKVDNTSPAQPVGAELVGGAGWRSRNDFAVRWTSQTENAAPIAAARYRICPVLSTSGQCATGVERGRDIRSISGIRVPGPGEWELAVWLEDEAGNNDPERSALLRVLRLDDAPPNLVIEKPVAADPTRVTVAASDRTSGISEAAIEARRRGESAWRGLPTTIGAKTFSAVLDDEALPKGVYELRARAVDNAGNERSTGTERGGEVAVRRLPIRIGTRLRVGAPARVRAKGSGGKRRYRTVLLVRPTARYGRTIPLRGRLTTPGANPLAGVDVEVWERVKLPAASWRRVGQVQTDRTGRFRFKALRGPSRVLRFRYPGTATIRARSTEVDLRVRAVTSIRVTRRSVVNGEEIRFRGRLKGRQTGLTGKLVHLQVYTRGRWSTFATPRARRQDGRWSYPYRFTATRGDVVYRFRALIPRESTFPYETGVTRSLRVKVRGL